jgi:hypothetical protein
MSRKTLPAISTDDLRAVSGGQATGRMPDSARNAIKGFYASSPKPGPGDEWIGPGKVSIRTTGSQGAGAWGYRATQGNVQRSGTVTSSGTVLENQPGEY